MKMWFFFFFLNLSPSTTTTTPHCSLLVAIFLFGLLSKENLNRSAVSIWPDHDGFKGGSIMSALLRKHLHALSNICHVRFSGLPAARRSILITAVKLKITNSGDSRFDKADVYSTWGLITSIAPGCLSPIVQILYPHIRFTSHTPGSDISLIMIFFCCLVYLERTQVIFYPHIVTQDITRCDLLGKGASKICITHRF